jgi:hypothetical protein
MRYLEERLGLQVEPSNVRLQPVEKDGYDWKFDVPQSYLFKKPLSDISTNMYLELLEHLKIGNIQAIAKKSAHDCASKLVVERLQEEIQDLKTKLQRSQKLNAAQQLEIQRLHNSNLEYVDKNQKMSEGHRKAKLRIQQFLEMMNNMIE